MTSATTTATNENVNKNAARPQNWSHTHTIHQYHLLTITINNTLSFTRHLMRYVVQTFFKQDVSQQLPESECQQFCKNVHRPFVMQ